MRPHWLAAWALVFVATALEAQARTWDEAYSLASATVNQMTIDEKLGIAYGTGQLSSTRSFPQSEIIMLALTCL
ncbi:hypothetical protein NMY22_g6301 [Coprinellus aureogranulatus]|nr:hypothetical protein NMY22_g6301 [Coprinellus aureogranulatus]